MDSGAIVILVIGVVFYFTPGAVASHRKHHQEGAIWVLNLFLGWTLLGWVGALVWACTTVKEPPKTTDAETQTDGTAYY